MKRYVESFEEAEKHLLQESRQKLWRCCSSICNEVTGAKQSLISYSLQFFMTVYLLITNWIVHHKVGSIQYKRGVIRVARAGHYFIYSQMYYFDSRLPVMAHYTYINDRNVMESVGSSVTPSTKYNTKYHGGVFLLRANDTISVRIPYVRNYEMKTDASFFGAFLLYSSD